jgi:hypothetical protein
MDFKISSVGKDGQHLAQLLRPLCLPAIEVAGGKFTAFMTLDGTKPGVRGDGDHALGFTGGAFEMHSAVCYLEGSCFCHGVAPLPFNHNAHGRAVLFDVGQGGGKNSFVCQLGDQVCAHPGLDALPLSPFMQGNPLQFGINQ